jgi:hypothetical protein
VRVGVCKSEGAWLAGAAWYGGGCSGGAACGCGVEATCDVTRLGAQELTAIAHVATTPTPLGRRPTGDAQAPPDETRAARGGPACGNDPFDSSLDMSHAGSGAAEQSARPVGEGDAHLEGKARLGAARLARVVAKIDGLRSERHALAHAIRQGRLDLARLRCRPRLVPALNRVGGTLPCDELPAA